MYRMFTVAHDFFSFLFRGNKQRQYESNIGFKYISGGHKSSLQMRVWIAIWIYVFRRHNVLVESKNILISHTFISKKY